mgnify:CR=1 FL=1
MKAYLSGAVDLRDDLLYEESRRLPILDLPPWCSPCVDIALPTRVPSTSVVRAGQYFPAAGIVIYSAE